MLLVGWFWVERPFETVFQSISGRLPKRGWLVGSFWLNGPLRQYFSLYREGVVGWCDGAGLSVYRAVSQREGERGEKG